MYQGRELCCKLAVAPQRSAWMCSVRMAAARCAGPLSYTPMCSCSLRLGEIVTTIPTIGEPAGRRLLLQGGVSVPPLSLWVGQQPSTVAATLGWAAAPALGAHSPPQSRLGGASAGSAGVHGCTARRRPLL